MIEKENILLKAPEERDIKGLWYEWLNDPEVTKYQNKGFFPNTREKQKEYMQKMEESNTDVLFAIYYKERPVHVGQHIGCIGLHNIDWINKSAKIGILIGDKKYWNKGIGKLSWNMITQYGLFTLNLHRIYADIFFKNKASLKVAKASGYKEEGIVRDKYYKDGKYNDVVIVSVLKDEFKEVRQ